MSAHSDGTGLLAPAHPTQNACLLTSGKYLFNSQNRQYYTLVYSIYIASYILQYLNNYILHGKVPIVLQIIARCQSSKQLHGKVPIVLQIIARCQSSKQLHGKVPIVLQIIESC